MKIFWEILGTKKKLYTGMAVKYVIDKKNGKKYYTGNCRLYKQKEYPKNLAENQWEQYDFCYGVPAFQQPDRIEKKGWFGQSRRIYSSVSPKTLEKEYLEIFGLWKIEELDLYTGMGIDYLRDKATGKEYSRGEMKLFKGEDDTPFPLAEHTNRYEYIYEINNFYGLTTEDYLREISTKLTINKLWGKK